MTAATAIEKFGVAVKDAVIKTGWAMSGYLPEVCTNEPSVSFTYTDGAKPVQTWAEFTESVEGQAMIKVADMPPLVTVEPLYDRFKTALRVVVHEAGENHVCSPSMRMVTCESGIAGLVGFAYVDRQGNGACIVGRVLQKMGVDMGALAQVEGMGADYVVRKFFPGERDLEVVASLACQAQMLNDSQQSWGLALAL